MPILSRLQTAAASIAAEMAVLDTASETCESCGSKHYRDWGAAQRWRELDAIRRKLAKFSREAPSGKRGAEYKGDVTK